MMYRTRILPFGSHASRLVETARKGAAGHPVVGGRVWWRRVAARLAKGALGVTLVVGAGCSGAPEPVARENPVQFRADWNDLDASVEAAAGAIEAAVMDASEPEAGLRVFELRTVSDAPGRLEVRRLGRAPGLTSGSLSAPARGNSPGEDVLLEARCTIGRFGDAAAEGKLLGALMRRAGQLRGRDVAPVD